MVRWGAGRVVAAAVVGALDALSSLPLVGSTRGVGWGWGVTFYPHIIRKSYNVK